MSISDSGTGKSYGRQTTAPLNYTNRYTQRFSAIYRVAYDEDRQIEELFTDNFIHGNSNERSFRTAPQS